MGMREDLSDGELWAGGCAEWWILFILVEMTVKTKTELWIIYTHSPDVSWNVSSSDIISAEWHRHIRDSRPTYVCAYQIQYVVFATNIECCDSSTGGKSTFVENLLWADRPSRNHNPKRQPYVVHLNDRINNLIFPQFSRFATVLWPMNRRHYRIWTINTSDCDEIAYCQCNRNKKDPV